MCLNLSKIQLSNNFKKSHLINGFDIIGDIAIVLNNLKLGKKFSLNFLILILFFFKKARFLENFVQRHCPI